MKNLSGPKTLMIVIGCLLLMVVAIAEYRFLGLSPVEKMSGTYTGDYADGKETLHLNRDGTFTECFVSDGKTLFTNHGRWKIDKFDDEDEQWLSFINLLVPINKGKDVTRKAAFSCNVDDNEGVIIFDEDQHIYVTKS